LSGPVASFDEVVEGAAGLEVPPASPESAAGQKLEHWMVGAIHSTQTLQDGKRVVRRPVDQERVRKRAKDRNMVRRELSGDQQENQASLRLAMMGIEMPEDMQELRGGMVDRLHHAASPAWMRAATSR
jgi:hypothetical protein